MENQLYITRNTEVSGKTYTSGNVYHFDKEEAADLIAQGIGEAVSIPTLSAIVQTATSKADSYAEERRELLSNPRYNDNETERRFLLSELEVKTVNEMNTFDFEYRAEIAALKIDAASKALDPVDTPEKITQAKAKADSIVTQFLISDTPTDIFRMLELAARSMTPAEKVETLKRWKEIEAHAGGQHPETAGIADSIKAKLRTVSNEHVKTLRHIAAVQESSNHATSKYKMIKGLQTVNRDYTKRENR